MHRFLIIYIIAYTDRDSRFVSQVINLLLGISERRSDRDSSKRSDDSRQSESHKLLI